MYGNNGLLNSEARIEQVENKSKEPCNNLFKTTVNITLSYK